MTKQTPNSSCMHMQSATLPGARDESHASHAHADAIFWNKGLHRIVLAQAQLVFSSVLFPKKSLFPSANRVCMALLPTHTSSTAPVGA